MLPKWMKKSFFNNKKYLSRKRFYMQAGFTVLLNLSLGFTGFFALRWLCAPVLNCWACPFAVFGCPVGLLGNLAALNLIAFGTIGVLVSFAVAIGRWTCGWVCPFGWLQELFYMIPTPKIKMPSFLRYGKYLALLFMVILVPVIYGAGTVKPKHLLPLGAEEELEDGEELEADSLNEFLAGKAFFCNYCPAGSLEATLPGVFSSKLFQDRACKRKVDKFIMGKLAGTEVAGEEYEELAYASECFGFEVYKVEFEEMSLTKTIFDVYGYVSEEGDDEDTPTELVISNEYPILKKNIELNIYMTEALLESEPDILIQKFELSQIADKLAIMLLFFVAFIFIKRPFCRIACPVGASLGLFSKVSLLRLKVDHDKCIKCDACTKRCPQGLSVYKDNFAASECILCNECVVICPTKAISYDNPLKLRKKPVEVVETEK